MWPRRLFRDLFDVDFGLEEAGHFKHLNNEERFAEAGPTYVKNSVGTLITPSGGLACFLLSMTATDSPREVYLSHIR